MKKSQLFCKIAAEMAMFMYEIHAKKSRTSWLSRRIARKDDMAWVMETAEVILARIAHKYNLQPKE